MSDIQTNRYDATLRRTADLKGPGSKVNDALTELFPMFDVENVPPELFLLGGTLLAMGFEDRTGAAGLFTNIGIFNPAGSGKIMTVTSCIISVAAPQVVFWSTRHTIFATTNLSVLSRDARVASPNIPTGLIRSEDSAGTLFQNSAALIGVALPLTLSDPNGLAVLPPGSGYAVGNSVVATRIVATFHWKERVAEPSELNL